MTKHPIEIEQALQLCILDGNCGSDCPYWSIPASLCNETLEADATEYLKQLKDENAKLKAELEELEKSNSLLRAENAALHAERGTGATKDIPVAIPLLSDALPFDEELRGEEFYADVGDEGDP